jgi:serine/threonine-protein kinase
MAASNLPQDDDLFIRASRREKAVSDEQITEGQNLQERMREMGLKPKPLGEILQERGYLTQERLDELLETVNRVKESFRIPGYKLLKRLGRGSMGTVYKARQLNLDRVVAIKILARFLAENQAFVRRFIKEARVIGKLNHPNIVQGFDAGEIEGTYYFAMEYCHGPTVLELLNRGGAMDQDRAIRIVTQVARALDHADQQGLVHRDIKPDNVMIVEGGVAKLCDLGLAKDVSRGSGSTEKGSTIGTPNYISPEQARGDSSIDIRSDIYSLGAAFYHMVTGVVPYDGPNPAVIMVKHLNEPLVPPRHRQPELDPDAQQIIATMMAKNPLDRYQSPAELLIDLENLMATRAGDPPPFPGGARRRRQRTGQPPPIRPQGPPRIVRRQDR